MSDLVLNAPLIYHFSKPLRETVFLRNYSACCSFLCDLNAFIFFYVLVVPLMTII